ncbi:MAG TPA: hypothetical protein VIB48_19510 [Acidimicrobiia bacterium]
MGPFMKVDHARGVVREAPDAPGAGPRAGAVPDVFAPISGISLERYAQLSKALGERGLEGAAVVAFLAGQGHTRVEWETASDGWNARMDADAALSTRFTALYESSPVI